MAGDEWLVVICREGVTEATPFSDESEARDYFARASLQWSDSYLTRTVKGPGSPLDRVDIRAAEVYRKALEPLLASWVSGPQWTIAVAYLTGEHQLALCEACRLMNIALDGEHKSGQQ